HADPQIPVLALAEWTEAAGRVVELAIEKTRAAYVVVPQHLAELPLLARKAERMFGDADPRIPIEMLRGDEATARFVETRHDLEMVRHPAIVRVAQGDEVGVDSRDAVGSRGAGPAVRVAANNLERQHR